MEFVNAVRHNALLYLKNAKCHYLPLCDRYTFALRELNLDNKKSPLTIKTELLTNLKLKDNCIIEPST